MLTYGQRQKKTGVPEMSRLTKRSPINMSTEALKERIVDRLYAYLWIEDAEHLEQYGTLREGIGKAIGKAIALYTQNEWLLCCEPDPDTAALEWSATKKDLAELRWWISEYMIRMRGDEA
jgi:hypothetical protein